MKTRQDFIDYFRSKKHKFLSPSKVFNDDQSLLFVNAGMNQLKSTFLGETIPDEGFTKLANSQICIRAGGKHNDLDDVGYDATHLTSFEMLGSWSLADYGRKETVALMFEYLVDRCGLSVDRMYVTYFEGNDQVPPDTETKDIWLTFLPEERVLPGNSKDNFWMMGETGPCGPCTEIHYDLQDSFEPLLVPELVNQDGSSVVEIWNAVFIQYQSDGNSFRPLEKMYVDTGMGLERLVTILEKKSTIYQTSIFRNLFGYAQALTGAEFYRDSYEDSSKVDIAYRIFVDGIRTVVVALFDSVEFGCHGREFVLRKIFRRLLTYLYLYLNDYKVECRFSHPLIQPMISDILNYYLKRQHDPIAIWEKLKQEEELYIGKLRFVERKITRHLHHHKGDVKEAFRHIQDSEGIPDMILQQSEHLKFK